MKRISSKKIRRRVWLASFLLGLLSGLFSGVQTWGEWSEAVKNAANDVAGSGASEDAQRVSFENNKTINRMGARGPAKGGVPNEVYTANQKAFTAKNNGFIQGAAEECGLDVEIKTKVDPKTGEPLDPLAGADTDVNVKTRDGKPLTYDQWKKLNDAYNQRVNEYLKKPAGSQVDTATDLMPDPDTTSPEDFQKINNQINEQGGTTYKDPTAVKVEAAMAKGKPVVLNEVGSYVKELQGQANDHFDAAAKTTAEANELAKSFGENSPEVQDLRAKAQIENSQGAKYIEKIENVGDRISSQAGSVSPQGEQAPSSKLTEVLKDNRGADTIAQSEQIGPLSQNALNNATQSTIEDLARIGQSNPGAAPACQQAIADSLRDLPMSQKGQAMDLIKTKYGNEFAKGVATAAQGPTAGASVMKGFDKVMKVLGPGLLVYDGYNRIKGALNAPDDAKTYVAGKAMGGFLGGLGVGAAVGLGVAAVLGAPVTVLGAAAVIGAGIIAGGVGYGVGDYAGSSLAGWMLEGVRPRDQSEYDALAAKGLLDGSKDVYGQLIAAGVDPRLAKAAADAYKRGDVKTFSSILKGIREQLVKNPVKMPPRRFKDMPTNEVQQLLDCLCSQSLGASAQVAQGYNLNIPADADPKIHSCGSLANGPCMAQGFGCWRSFIKWGNPGIADCLASFNLPTNSGFVRGQIDAQYQKPYEKPFKVGVKIEPLDFCPGDEVHVTLTPEGGRGDYEFRYAAGWPLQRPKDGPKDAFTTTKSSSMTFTADPTLTRGGGVYTRPYEAYVTYIQVWVTSSTYENGELVPLQFCKTLGARLRSDPECQKLHPPAPPETKKPPAKPPVKGVSKPVGETQVTEPPAPGERVNVDGGSLPPPVTKTTGSKPPPKGTHKTTKGATTSKTSSSSQGSHGPKGTSGQPPEEGTATGNPVTEGEQGAAPPPGTECSFGGGGTAINNGPVNMWMEVPAGQHIRVTIKGSDGFTQTIEGVGRVDISRPRNPNGADAITMENLDVPGCTQQQVAQYDTNGIPMGEPGKGLEQAEPTMAGSTGDQADTSILDGYVTDQGEKGKRETDSGFKTLGTATKSSQKETSSDMDLASAAHVRDTGGADAQDTKNNTAKDTAKSDQDNSWSKTFGDSIQKGFEDGAKATASAFGTAAADGTVGAIFGNPKKDSDKNKGESSSDQGTQVASGSKSIGGSKGCSTGQGGVPPPPGQPSPAPPPTQTCSTSNGVKGITMTCKFCGYTETLPPGVQPDPNSHCPKCGCGADKGVVTCDMCGYRWLVDAATGPTGPCPNCGGKGKVTLDGDRTGTAVGQEPGHVVGSGISGAGSTEPGNVVGSGIGAGVPPPAPVPAPLGR